MHKGERKAMILMMRTYRTILILNCYTYYSTHTIYAYVSSPYCEHITCAPGDTA